MKTFSWLITLLIFAQATNLSFADPPASNPAAPPRITPSNPPDSNSFKNKLLKLMDNLDIPVSVDGAARSADYHFGDQFDENNYRRTMIALGAFALTFGAAVSYVMTKTGGSKNASAIGINMLLALPDEQRATFSKSYRAKIDNAGTKCGGDAYYKLLAGLRVTSEEVKDRSLECRHTVFMLLHPDSAENQIVPPASSISPLSEKPSSSPVVIPPSYAQPFAQGAGARSL